MILNDGYDSKKIWLGMDLGYFLSPGCYTRSHPVILAMARPTTPRRGFDVLVEALSIVKSQVEDIEINLFGDDLSQYSIPFEYVDMGVICNQNYLASAYSSADIFIDASDFQGFGRTALEAMACETACVLTNVGGVTEYAEDGYNCLLVPPHKPEEISKSVLRLLNDGSLVSKITDGGRATASKYSHKVEAQETLKYFTEISCFEYSR